MSRGKVLIVFIVLRFIPTAVIGFTLGRLRLSHWAGLSIMIAIFGICWVYADFLETWADLTRIAYGLADDAASALADAEDDVLESQVSQGFTRRSLPRQVYACAIARRSEPIQMYRGWKMWDTSPLCNPSDTRPPSLSCRRLMRLFSFRFYLDSMLYSRCACTCRRDAPNHTP